MRNNIQITTKSGKVYTFTPIDNNEVGNPRYVVHFVNLGLDKYLTTKETVELGLTKYRGKAYGGGFVFSHYNLEGFAEKLEAKGLFIE